jgi:ribosomal protein L37E
MDHEKGRMMTTVWPAAARYLGLSRGKRKTLELSSGCRHCGRSSENYKVWISCGFCPQPKTVYWRIEQKYSRLQVKKHTSQNTI